MDSTVTTAPAFPIPRPRARRRTAAVLLLGLAALLSPVVPAQDDEAYTGAMRAGRAAMRARDHAAAAEAYRRATTLRPDDPAPFLDLGIARSAMRDWDGAVEAYRRVTELDPAGAKAYNNIGNVYFRQARYEEALGYYRQALERDPDYLLALYHLGWITRHLNRPEESQRAFERCLALRPSNRNEQRLQLDARFYLGALRFRARDYPTAATLMEQVLTANPYHPEAHYYLGQAYLRLGRREDGRRHLELYRQIVESRRGSEPVASGGGS